MKKMIKLVNSNIKTAITNMLKDLKGKHKLDEKRNRSYINLNKTQVELEYNI